MSSQDTGKNIIIDRKVRGKIQIIAPRKVTKVEAYQMFLSALWLQCDRYLQ